MISKNTRLFAPAAMLAAFGLAAATQPASAADTLVLPAGLGCAFNLGISAADGNLHTKVFTDKNGNVVRTITAGKGTDLTFTNYGPDPNKPEAGKSVTIKTAGSVSKAVENGDGSQTVTATGHNAVIVFPTDIPAGPTTTLYIGKLVYYFVPATGFFRLISAAGPQRDICAELAG